MGNLATHTRRKTIRKRKKRTRRKTRRKRKKVVMVRAKARIRNKANQIQRQHRTLNRLLLLLQAATMKERGPCNSMTESRISKGRPKPLMELQTKNLALLHQANHTRSKTIRKRKKHTRRTTRRKRKTVETLRTKARISYKVNQIHGKHRTLNQLVLFLQATMQN